MSKLELIQIINDRLKTNGLTNYKCVNVHRISINHSYYTSINCMADFEDSSDMIQFTIKKQMSKIAASDIEQLFKHMCKMKI